jgi:hypothetical protein
MQLTHAEANIGVQGILYPSIKHGLNATTIPWKELDHLQAPLTTTILPTIGYNQHMPREVVHAPIFFGGIGIQRLSTEQGILHIQHLLGSLRCNDKDSSAIYGLLESYTITTGIIGNPLETPIPITYYCAPWIDIVIQYLYSINGKIIISKLETPQLIREHDIAIMEKATKFTSNKKHCNVSITAGYF